MQSSHIFSVINSKDGMRPSPGFQQTPRSSGLTLAENTDQLSKSSNS
jgi:hypothetical protein